jgi:4-hydroxy-tetrahydrodipicolinate synthase
VLLVTPFDDEQELDFESYRNLLRYVISEGVDGLIPLGTTGEFFSLTFEEKKQVVDVTIEEAAGRVPVCVGVGYSGTRISADLARYAERTGAAAVLVPPPYYYPSTDPGIVRHFVAIAQSIDVPVMLYDGGGGTSIPIPVLEQVTQACENVTLIKASVLDGTKVSKILAALGDRVTVLCGDEVMLLPELEFGAQGMATASGNVLPHICTEICRGFVDGRRDEARSLYDRYLAPWTVASGIAKHEFVRCFKEVLAEMGVIATPVTRLPLGELDPVRRRELIATATRLGIIR